MGDGGPLGRGGGAGGARQARRGHGPFIDLEERCREEGDGEVLLACWENLGRLCGLQGLWKEAATAYEVALDVAADVGADDGTTDELRAELARARASAEG